MAAASSVPRRRDRLRRLFGRNFVVQPQDPIPTIEVAATSTRHLVSTSGSTDLPNVSDVKARMSVEDPRVSTKEDGSPAHQNDAPHSSLPTRGTNTIRDFWNEALSGLASEDQSIIRNHFQLTLGDVNLTLEALSKSIRTRIEVVEQKRWTFSFGNHEYSFREEASKVIQWLDRFKQAGDIAVNADPMHAGLPWALIRVLLQAAVSDHDQICALFIGLDKVGYIVNRCRLYFEMYLTYAAPSVATVRTSLEKALLNLYTLILRFLSKALQTLAKGTIRRLLSACWSPESILSFEKECRAVEERTEGAITDFERTIAHLHQKETINILNNFRRNMEDLDAMKRSMKSLSERFDEIWAIKGLERRGEVLRWVSMIPHQDHHTIAINGRTDNTGEWLFDRREFVSWNEHIESMILWLHGIPGAGKTKLASLAVDWFQKSCNALTSCAFFYCNQYEETRRNANEILRSFVKQLGGSGSGPDRIHAKLDDIYCKKQQSGYASLSLSMTETQEILGDLISSSARTTLILDGLDECHESDRVELITTFDRMVNSFPNLKIFISSRRNDDIVRRLKTKTNVGVEASDNAQDIRLYVNQKIKDDAHRRIELGQKPISNELTGEIVRVLFEKSQGMFQWTALHIEQLLRLEREKDIRARLNTLPIGMTRAYDEIMAMIEAQEGSRPHVAFKSLQWLLASNGIISAWRLLAAVCQDSDNDEICPVDIDVDFLLGACQNLVTLAGPKRVRFSHLSVQEYLQSSGKWSVEECEDLIAKVCLKIVVAKQDGPVEDDILRALLGFARSEWHQRAKKNMQRRRVGSTDEITPLLRRFFGVPVPSVSPYLQSTSPYHRWVSTGRHNMSGQNSRHVWSANLFTQDNPQVLLCLCGFDPILEDWILNHDLNVNWKNEEGYSLLFFAISEMNWATTCLLLDRGANASFDEPALWSALEVALFGKELRFLQLLVHRGANVNLAGGHDFHKSGLLTLERHFRARGTLLAVAAENSDIEVMDFLLEHGADVDCADKTDKNLFSVELSQRRFKSAALLVQHGADIETPYLYENTTALIMATEAGEEHLVDLLIQRGVEVNELRSLGSYQTALQAAIRYHYTKIIKRLRLHGARFDVGRGGSSMLVDACWEDRKETVELLLVAGVDVNESGTTFWNGTRSPLIAAAEAGRTAIVQLLLSKGADANKHVAESKYTNALSAAIDSGSRHCIDLLLQNGADINARGGVSGSPLATATKNYDVDIMELLLQKGADPNARISGQLLDFHFTTALEAAFFLLVPSRSLHETVNLLLEHGATVTDEVKERMEGLLQFKGINDSTRGCIIMFDEISSIAFDAEVTGKTRGPRRTNFEQREPAHVTLDIGRLRYNRG